MNKKVLIAGTIAILLLLLIPSVSATWCDNNYGKKAPILINNTGGSAQTYYQVELNISHDSDMNANFSDIRVYNETDCSLVPLWNESAVASSWNQIWFNATNIPASSWTNDTYYMYYDYSSASSVSNITSTFIFGDNFETGESTYSASRSVGSSIGFKAATPRVVVADNGTWLMVYRAKANGSAPTGHEGQVWIRNSTDNGETWSAGTKLSSDAYDAINAEVVKYPNGDIEIFYTRYDDSTSTHHTPNMVSRSIDNGSSWSAFVTAPTPLDAEYQVMWQEIIIGSDVYLATYKKNISTSHYSNPFYKTEDNGTTWTKISDITTYAAEGDYSEPGLVYLGDGDFVSVLRDGGNANTLQKRSTDWGANWTTDGYIKTDGSVAGGGVGTDVVLHQCRLWNKDINGNDLGYVYMQANLYPGSYPRDMYAYFSTDDCASWGSKSLIYGAADCHDSGLVLKTSSSAKYYPGRLSGESNTTDDDISISLEETPSATKWDILITAVTLSSDYAFRSSKSAKFAAGGVLTKTLVHSDNIAIKYWAYFPSQPYTFYPFLHGDATSRLYVVVGEPAAGDISYHDGSWHDTGVNTVTGAWKSFEAKNFVWASHTQDILYNEVEIASDVGQRSGSDYDDVFKIYSLGANYYVDCFLIRKYSTPEPTAQLGAEESPAAQAYTPPYPTNLQSTTENFWVNYTWDAGSGNVTNGYNVTWNASWDNTSNTYMNKSVGASGWANITVWAWNSSSNGTISTGSISDNVQVSSGTDTSFTVTLPVGYTYIHFNLTGVWNASTQTNYAPEGQSDSVAFYNVTNTGTVNLYVRMQLNATVSLITLKADNDNNPVGAKEVNATLVTIGSSLSSGNSMNIWLWSDFDHTTQQTINRTLYINVTDKSVIPPNPVNLQNSTGNFYVNYTWDAGSGVVTDGYNVTWNASWDNTSNTYMNKSVGASGWANITVYAFNSTGIGKMSTGNVSDKVQAPAGESYTETLYAEDLTSGSGNTINSESNAYDAADTTVAEVVDLDDGQYVDAVIDNHLASGTITSVKFKIKLKKGTGWDNDYLDIAYYETTWHEVGTDYVVQDTLTWTENYTATDVDTWDEVDAMQVRLTGDQNAGPDNGAIEIDAYHIYVDYTS